METLQETKLKTIEQIVDEITTPYIADPNQRSINSKGNCVYNGPNGKICAFARACIDPTTFIEGESAYSLLTSKGFNILKPEYRHIQTKMFWNQLQELHDGDNGWNEGGLSEVGICKMKFLKNNYSHLTN